MRKESILGLLICVALGFNPSAMAQCTNGECPPNAYLTASDVGVPLPFD